MKNQSKLSIITAYLIVYFVWGSTFFFIHRALSDFSPFLLGSLRFLTASLLLFGYCAIKGYKLFSPRIVKQSCIIGFLLLFIDMGAIIWAEQYVSSGIAAIMAAAAALWFVILDKPQWKNNFSKKHIVMGLLSGFIGVVMLFSEQLYISVPPSQKLLNLFCMLLLILGSIAWTSGSLYSKYTSTKNQNQGEDLHVMVKTSWQMITAGVMFTLVGLCNGEYASFQPKTVSSSGWFSLGYLIVLGSILTFIAYIWLIQSRPTTEVSTHVYINPVVAIFLSYFFTNDIITNLQISGLIVILMSVLLMNWNLYKDSKLFRRAQIKWYYFRRRLIF
ncbi:EamA family transporter [Elizabethkingia argentiflava]|uniref:EamA family transporter n=1 Tax=Elizabethkingia argenteiflava TaxID=2681556 RepID=A0A845PVV6_9FLAO|nr:EamA family transporter [Elizabethkingia argenteiflava]NAW51101.1 EamA family transporter [Elizabethkingia argenteiflava]